MTAQILRFPPRRSVCVWVRREGKAWLVLAGSYGWLHSDFPAAILDAKDIAAGFGLAVRVAA